MSDFEFPPRYHTSRSKTSSEIFARTSSACALPSDSVLTVDGRAALVIQNVKAYGELLN